jgi:hypothetical protein
MEPEPHEMIRVESNQTETMFECLAEGCDRVVVLNRQDRRLTVVKVGDAAALHYGSSGLISLEATATPRTVG